LDPVHSDVLQEDKLPELYHRFSSLRGQVGQVEDHLPVRILWECDCADDLQLGAVYGGSVGRTVGSSRVHLWRKNRDQSTKIPARCSRREKKMEFF